MIHYDLKCSDDHSFDSWFQSAEAFDKLLAAGMVSCAVCGLTSVSKALMAPRLNKSEDETRALSRPATPAEQAIARLRKHVEENATYVGGSFAAEARAIHDGSAPERAIWGETRPDEARALVEDGIPVAPLPFTPRNKAN